MTQCSWPKCRESEDLQRVRAVRNERVYHYCDEHDPTGSHGFVEVEDGG